MKFNVPGYMTTSKPIPPSIYENYQWCLGIDLTKLLQP
jgi:hypothetical protein